MTKVLVIYDSMSGNTQEVARMIEEEMVESNFDVTMFRVGTGFTPSPAEYDIMLLGTYTWDKGSVPDEVKDVVYDIGYKPDNVIVFGTGDTQFGGDDLFCLATEKLAKFYNSPYPPLKIEQSPRGTQEGVVTDWVKGLIEMFRVEEYEITAV